MFCESCIKTSSKNKNLYNFIFKHKLVAVVYESVAQVLDNTNTFYCFLS